MASVAPSKPAQAPASLSSSLDEKIPLIDWEGLRRRSLQPGGFGTNRIQIWCVILSGPRTLFSDLDLREFFHLNRPQLLHASKLAEKTEEKGELVEEHRDERQIRLDTDRSFVLYPVGEKALPAPVSSFITGALLTYVV